MLKAYAFGLFSAALAVLLVAAIWIGTQPKQEAGLLWGDTVYSSRQEFNGYLKSNGLSYKTWVARNPNAAPWEPEEFTLGAITVQASTKTVQLLLASIGWLLATAGALLLLRGGRPDMPGFAKGSVALFSTVLAGLLAGGIWFSTQSRQEPGLEWGGTVYTSKQDFKVYLKSKGLSYNLWVARNPGAAPWESAAVRISTKAPEVAKARVVTNAPETPAASAGWVGRPLLAVIGLMFAAVSGLLLLRARRPVLARYAATSSASGTVSIAGSSAGSPRTVASIQRVGGMVSEAAERLKTSAPSYGARLIAAPRSVARIVIGGARAVIAGAREVRSGLAHVMRERHLSGGDVAYGVLAIMSPVVFVLIVVFVLSA